MCAVEYMLCGMWVCFAEGGRWDWTDVGELGGEWAGESEGGKIKRVGLVNWCIY